jgi:hypothetical protein
MRVHFSVGIFKGACVYLNKGVHALSVGLRGRSGNGMVPHPSGSENLECRCLEGKGNAKIVG